MPNIPVQPEQERLQTENRKLRIAMEAMYWSGWSDCHHFGYTKCNRKTRDKAIAETLKDIEWSGGL